MTPAITRGRALTRTLRTRHNVNQADPSPTHFTALLAHILTRSVCVCSWPQLETAVADANARISRTCKLRGRGEVRSFFFVLLSFHHPPIAGRRRHSSSSSSSAIHYKAMAVGSSSPSAAMSTAHLPALRQLLRRVRRSLGLANDSKASMAGGEGIASL